MLWEEMADAHACAGAFVNGFNPNGSSPLGRPVPPKPPKDPISEDPVVPEDPVTTTATPATRAGAQPQTPPPAQPSTILPDTASAPAAAATALPTSTPVDSGAPTAALPVVPALAPGFMKHVLAHAMDQDVMDFRFGDMLGDTFMFYEAQHSGNITSIPGGSRHGWRGVQMLEDGADVSLDLVGGMYEAGSAPPPTPPTSTDTARPCPRAASTSAQQPPHNANQSREEVLVLLWAPHV